MKTKAIKVTVTTWTPSWSVLPNHSWEDEQANEEEEEYYIDVDGLDEDEACTAAEDFGTHMVFQHDEEEDGRGIDYELGEIEEVEVKTEDKISEWTIINQE